MRKIVPMLVMAILLTACAGAGSSRLCLRAAGHPLTRATLPTPPQAEEDSGVRLPISPNTSVNIDVSGIIEYIDQESLLQSDIDTDDPTGPWVRFNLTF